MQPKWRQVLALVWKNKWEAVLGIIGGVGAFVAADTPLWLAVLLGAISLALLIDLFLYIRTTVRLVREKHIPAIVIVGKNDDEFRTMVKDVWRTMAPLGFSEHQFDEEWDIERYDLVTYYEPLLAEHPEPWEMLARRFERKISRLSAQLQGRRVFHIFLNCPSGLAVGLGSLAGTRYEMVLHQFQPGSGQQLYYPVLDFSSAGAASLSSGSHWLKQQVQPPYQYIEVMRPAGELTPEIFVSLHLSGHIPQEAVSRLAEEHQCAAVHIGNTYQNLLSVEDDWAGVVREVTTEMLALTGSGRQRIHLCLNCPVVVAFALGMALGIHVSVTVYHWFAAAQRYRPVLHLERLRG